MKRGLGAAAEVLSGTGSSPRQVVSAVAEAASARAADLGRPTSGSRLQVAAEMGTNAAVAEKQQRGGAGGVEVCADCAEGRICKVMATSRPARR